MQSLTPLDLKPDFTRQDFEAILKPLRRGTDNLVVFQTNHQRKDGTVYPVEMRVQLSRAEIYPVFVAVSLDITEKQKTEKELAGYRNHPSGTRDPLHPVSADQTGSPCRPAPQSLKTLYFCPYLLNLCTKCIMGVLRKSTLLEPQFMRRCGDSRFPWEKRWTR